MAGGWTVLGATDTAPNASDMRVSVRGQPAGRFSELKVIYDVAGFASPQVFSVKGSGALRSTPPSGEWGATSYGTGYWDCNPNVPFDLTQTMPIRRLDIRLDPVFPSLLRMKGVAANPTSLRAPDFTLRFLPPTADSTQVQVSYSLVATRAFCISSDRQLDHEGFKVARIASSYISAQTHDSDQARYVDTAGTAVCASLDNDSDHWIFSQPPAHMGQRRLFLVHTDTSPRRTPTVSIGLSKPPLRELRPQGWVHMSADENDDNVDLWVNWDAAKPSYSQGEVLGTMVFTLDTASPQPLPCQ